MIGTAGHVDHGKTTLIQALTGIDADRLPEEKERGMTIDVGFAYLDLPKHGRVSIVDVPGHEKFIHNMLVGALGVDVALLCVAADAGVMPQTREHVEILQLLPVTQLVVALTRADLADADMRELVLVDVTEHLSETRFAGSPTVQVSAVTGEGLPQLRETLAAALDAATDGERTGPWYLPMDRVFALKGHGVVVTGTLAQGKVTVGESARITPGDLTARVRSLHSHGQSLESVEAGKRVAMNLGGVRLEDLHRGQAVGSPAAMFETTRLDAEVTWIREAKHGMRVRLSIGAAEVMGKLFLNDVDVNWVQVALDEPVAAARLQPLVIRRASPMEVLGGGRVRIPVALKRKRSDPPPRISGADRPTAICELIGDAPEGLTSEEIARSLGVGLSELGDDFEGLRHLGVLRGFAGRWVSETGYQAIVGLVRGALQQLHEGNPMQSLHPREKVLDNVGLRWSGKPLDRLIAQLAVDGVVGVEGTGIRSADFRLQLSPKQRVFLDRVKEVLDAACVNVPGMNDLSRSLNVPPQAVDEIVRLGQEARELVRVGDGLVYTVDGLASVQARLREEFGNRPFEASEVRDLLGSSRRYVIPLLEYFDSRGITQRTADRRAFR